MFTPFKQQIFFNFKRCIRRDTYDVIIEFCVDINITSIFLANQNKHYNITLKTLNHFLILLNVLRRKSIKQINHFKIFFFVIYWKIKSNIFSKLNWTYMIWIFRWQELCCLGVLRLTWIRHRFYSLFQCCRLWLKTFKFNWWYYLRKRKLHQVRIILINDIYFYDVWET